MVQLNSAESRVRVAKISLEQIEATYKRDEDLHKQGVISKEDYETSLANYKKAQEEAENAHDSQDFLNDTILHNYLNFQFPIYNIQFPLFFSDSINSLNLHGSPGRNQSSHKSADK